MIFISHDEAGQQIEILKLCIDLSKEQFLASWLVSCIVIDHLYYFAVQYHSEYLSRSLNPSPPYLGLILASSNELKNYISRGCNISPWLSYDFTSADDDDDDDEVTQALCTNNQ